MAESVHNIKLWKKAQKVESQQTGDYSAAQNQIEIKLRDYYGRSLAYKRGVLNSAELARFKKTLRNIRELAVELEDLELREKIDKLLARKTITREEALLFDIDFEIERLTSMIIQDTDVLLTDSIKDAYDSAVLLVKRAAPQTKVPSRQLSDIIAKEIKLHEYPGATYDQFVKDRHKKFARDLKKTVIKSLRTGTGITAVMADIRKLTKRQKGYAKTWIRNQMSFALNLASQEAFKKLRVEKYVFNAVVDHRTTAVCLSLNGKVFKVVDGVPGVNMPPMQPPLHPCRSYITPYFEKE